MKSMLIRSGLSLLSPAGPGARLSILIFHRVLKEPDPLFPGEIDCQRFEELVGWIAGWFNVLPLDEAIRRLDEGRLPARAAAITFDDGYADNFLNALPILQRHGLHATFFIATGFLDGGRMWNDTVIEAVRGARIEWLDPRIDGVSPGALRSTDEKRSMLSRLIPAVKHLAPVARAEAVARIADAAEAVLPSDLMLNTGQLRALRQAGMGIGAHTMTHPILAATGDAQAEDEIAGSKERLEILLGEPVTLFAYPNGKPGADYTCRHIEMLKAHGFDAAVSTCWGANDSQSDPYQLLRFTPWDRQGWRFGLRLMDNLRRQSSSLAC